MLKLYDYECRECKTHTEHMIDVPANTRPQPSVRKRCYACQKQTTQSRLMSAPAKYMGEKAHNPQVYGGKFDTMGYRAPPRLPELKDGEDLHDYTKANKEAIRQHKEVRKQNKAKQDRAMALKSGKTVNMRAERLAGDPKI